MSKTAPKAIAVQTPGDPVDADAGDDLSAGLGQSDDASAARIAELEAVVAQQNALISQMSADLQGLATVNTAQPKGPAERRLIGEDWSTRTSAEAQAAGVTGTVLCKDGYYVPGA